MNYNRKFKLLLFRTKMHKKVWKILHNLHYCFSPVTTYFITFLRFTFFNLHAENLIQDIYVFYQLEIAFHSILKWVRFCAVPTSSTFLGPSQVMTAGWETRLCFTDASGGKIKIQQRFWQKKRRAKGNQLWAEHFPTSAGCTNITVPRSRILNTDIQYFSCAFQYFRINSIINW